MHKSNEYILKDNYGRILDYLRILVTDRCNLRCTYCMPAEGIPLVSRSEIMTFEEIERVIQIFSGKELKKIRFTGGEPFLRKDFADFILRIDKKKYAEKINITTNGILTARFIDTLKEISASTINLSLDSLKPEKFKEITRFNAYEKVMETFYLLIAKKIPLKINVVVQKNINDDEINDFVELTKNFNIEVRFIEEMPFNGTTEKEAFLNYKQITNIISEKYSQINPMISGDSTADKYKVPGYKGSVGIIAAYSRTFCNTCSRIRLTPVGDLKWCLYDSVALNLKDLMRRGISNKKIAERILSSLQFRKENGFEAEAASQDEMYKSMSLIGG